MPNQIPRSLRYFFLRCLTLGLSAWALADDLPRDFHSPPDSARPGVYWYFMDGNLSREGMTRDLESMKAAGLGHLVFLEVNVGVPRGPVGFLSEPWQDLFAHAVRESERLGIEITLGSGPGWTGSGGPWVKPEQSMQHLVASTVTAKGPGAFKGTLPVPPPRRPFFGAVPGSMKEKWQSWFRDVAVLAFPTPPAAATIPDIDEKALYYRAPYSSQPNVKPRLPAPADHAADPPGTGIPRDKILDLTSKLRPDGSLDWQVPAGEWTVLRFVSRNNGASTRPAPEPGIGFECDKFDAAALDAHFAEYGEKLLRKTEPRAKGRGWTMLHIDSWEMGAQNWTPKWREEFLRRRGYDPQPFYPAYLGHLVGSREESERFLWDLRLIGQELVLDNHARRLKDLGRKHGLSLSIEPYDMNPTCDFDLGAVADVPMCEFWSLGFDTTFSVHTASSIAHVLGRPVVAAEAFTGAPGENWKFHPGSLKNQGDWALCSGVNRFTYHTFAHKPDESRPGMVMGPYGVHWDRGQTWWPMVADYHRYITRCQHLLRQGNTVADILYLLPEGAPNVFTPPASAFTGTKQFPDRRGHNFDACSPQILIDLAKVQDGQVVFPSGASYHLLVLPDSDTMTPNLLGKIASLVRDGATVIGNPPRKSPSLVKYPACDREVVDMARNLWGDLPLPPGNPVRIHGKGRVVWGRDLTESVAGEHRRAILDAKWIWRNHGNPAQSAPLESVRFLRAFTIAADRKIKSAVLDITADNSFVARINGTAVGNGDNFHNVDRFTLTRHLRPGANVLEVLAENGGDTPNPAGLLAALRIEYADGATETILTDKQWQASLADQPGAAQAAKELGKATMSPWNLKSQPPTSEIYPNHTLLTELAGGKSLPEDFSSQVALRYTHRRTADRDLYFVSNRSPEAFRTTATFRVANGVPELWDPLDGSIRALPEFTRREDRTEVPLEFAPYGSFFVVFPRSPDAASAKPNGKHNFPPFQALATLGGAWEVSFDSDLGAPATARFEQLTDWSQHQDPGIRHYSGIATYRKTFDLPSNITAGQPLFLDLGRVEVMARVRLNGKDCGTRWTAPWRVDIGTATKAGANQLEIEVANLWPNRMIGDAKAPDRSISKTTYRPFKASDPLLPSGLLGPVRFARSSATAP